ncbi:MAG: glycosyltransferase family 4 protein [Arenicellales bacterium]
MRALNIAMVAACPFPENRGTPSRILRMSEALAEQGHSVHVVTYHFGKDIETTGITIHRIPGVVPYKNFSAGPTITKLSLLDPLLFFTLLKVVKENSIDLIHAHHFEGALISYPVRAIRGIPVIYDAHTTLTDELSSYRFWNLKRVARFLDGYVPRQANFNVAVSDELKNRMLRAGIPDASIAVVPTGVDYSDFINPHPQRIIDKHGLQSRKVVVYTGSLANFQGVDYLFEAMQRVCSKDKDSILLVVGIDKGDKYARFVRELGIEDSVCFVGNKPFSEIPDYLACADVAVVPRVNCPGIPQKLTNYMMAEKAIVGFEGSAKLLTHGVDGMVIADGNVEQMANAIVSLLHDPEARKRLGRKARTTAREKYDWSVLSRQVADIYSTLLKP